jgi:hypothetical protein
LRSGDEFPPTLVEIFPAPISGLGDEFPPILAQICPVFMEGYRIDCLSYVCIASAAYTNDGKVNIPIIMQRNDLASPVWNLFFIDAAIFIIG